MFNIIGRLNDVWKFNLTSDTWEYLSGSQKINTPINDHSPGGLTDHAMVFDSSDSSFIVFAGQGYVDSNNIGIVMWWFNVIGLFNDVWKYSIGGTSMPSTYISTAEPSEQTPIETTNAENINGTSAVMIGFISFLICLLF